MEHVHIHITGIVQGVGMRPFVYRAAVTHGIAGWVLNASDGVHIEAHGEAIAIREFVNALREEAPAAASVRDIKVAELADQDFDLHDLDGFRIIASEDEGERTTLVSPDIATCPDCLRELFDPADRRYHYPFINCTNCGPRFTIIRSLPYDRASTSMDAFPMCPGCAREYTDPLNRRFHAQPDACFACGPHITWREAETAHALPHGDSKAVPAVGHTREESDAIIERCVELLASDGIVAIKGLGGFHLACDAVNEIAVRELRRRKRRSNKPLAVMVRDIEDARALCQVDGTEHALLTGTVRPIVLLRRRPTLSNDPGVAPSVAFDLPELGIMLPYTPLQHLLLAACNEQGIRALVMTSGNISEEPIEVDDETAWADLVESGIADALLGNDRAVLARYDDSVVRVVDGKAQMVRRARGYAPRPLELPHVGALSDAAVARMCKDMVRTAPVILACGSEQKATLAFTREQEDGTTTCFLSQHIGDVENGATFDAWHATRAHFQELFDLQPTVLACDVHPRYLPSLWAREQARTNGMPLIEIQHHHAHIASVIAETAARGECGSNESVIGIAFDGTGAGAMRAATGELKPDGTIWGGEFLIASLTDFTRAAHLRPWRLPGGGASVRDLRRNAFSLLSMCNLLDHPGARPLLASLTEEERAITATMIERGLNSPLTSSMGRFLDAIAAILGICRHATYEGEPAILLEAAAHRAATTDIPAIGELARLVQEQHAPMPEQLPAKQPAAPAILDPTPLLTRLLDGIVADKQAEDLALLAHQAVIGTTASQAAELAKQTGIRTVALSGGVFMNRLLLSGIRRALEQQGLTVLTPRDVPVNDGCIAYGQAAIARATLAQRQQN